MSQEQPVPEKRSLLDVRGLPWWQIVLVVAPIALTVAGGLVGGACAAAAMLANMKIARTGLAAPVKALAMVAIDAAAVLAWYVIATALLNSIS